MSLDSRSDELDKRIEDNDIDKGIEALSKGVSRQRRTIRFLIIAFALDFILSIGLIAVAIKTNEALQLSQNNKEAVVANCETANEARKNNRALWDYILAIPTPNAPTIEQQKNRTDFKAFVDKTFAPRDCQAEINK